MTIITDDWHPKVKGAKIRRIFPLQRQNCFVFWKIFVHHIIGKEKCWFGMVKVWNCYLWFFTDILSKLRTFSKTPPWIRPPPADFFLMSSAGIKLMIRGTSWTEWFAINWQLKIPNKYGKPLRSSGPLLQSVICWKRRICWSRTCSKWCWNLQ